MHGPPDHGARQGRITLQMIADHLNVSTATVSLALRDSPMVADRTRAKVHDIAQAFGYQNGRNGALSPRLARSNVVTLGFHDIGNPFLAELLEAIEDTLAGSGRTVILGAYGDDPERQTHVLSRLKDQRPAGMIVCPAEGADRESLAAIASGGTPVVQIAREVANAGLDFVGADEGRSARLALDHLFGLGHRRIALVGASQGTDDGKRRVDAYRSFLQEKGIPLDPRFAETRAKGREAGFAATTRLLALDGGPTAAFCCDDHTAFGVMLALRRAGREAGRDFSVVGADDVSEAALWAPGLTTVRRSATEIGRRAAERVLLRIMNPSLKPERIVIESTLVVRGSTTRPH